MPANLTEPERQSFRVPIEDGDVQELAVWFKKRQPLQDMSLAELGKPHLLLDRMHFSARLVNLSAEGFNLAISYTGSRDPERLKAYMVLAYLKLNSPMDPLDDPACFMLGCEIARLERAGDVVTLGLRISHEGLPCQDRKALSFVNVEKYGISDLTRWCDEKDRAIRMGCCVARTGLRLDRLLAEVAAATGEAASPGGASPRAR